MDFLHLNEIGVGQSQYMPRYLGYGGRDWAKDGYPNLAFDPAFGPPLRVAVLGHGGSPVTVMEPGDPHFCRVEAYQVLLHKDDVEEFRRRYERHWERLPPPKEAPRVGFWRRLLGKK